MKRRAPERPAVGRRHIDGGTIARDERARLVASEWLRRVEAEYRSAAATQELGLWLLQIGASPDLVRATGRITRDELAHAELSMRCHVAAGGAETPVMAEASLGLTRRHARLLDDVVCAGVEIFCLGETVAVPLFAEMRRGCDVPAARRALDRVLRDEVRHRDFGWTLLGWLLEQPFEGHVRELVARELPEMFARVRASYAPAHAPVSDLSREARRWGLIPVARYGEILARAAERDYFPRFETMGIDARAAWTT